MQIKSEIPKIKITGQNSKMVSCSYLFQSWLNSLDEKLKVISVFVQSVDIITRNGKQEILFLKFRAEIVDSFGRSLPGIVFLRGPSVGIFIVLQTKKQDYAVLIESAQPAVGMQSYLQLPAGMMDGEKDALSVAKREMKEETGIDPQGGQMFDLTEKFYGKSWKGIYPSPGACDEYIRLFLFRKKTTESEIKALQGKKTGLTSENEHLVLKIVKLQDLCKITPDVKAHSAYMIYRELLEKGAL